MPEPHTFTCALCLVTFEAEWSDEEAAAEYQRDFIEGKADLYSPEDLLDPDIVCEGCYEFMQPFIEALDAQQAAELNS